MKDAMDDGVGKVVMATTSGKAKTKTKQGEKEPKVLVRAERATHESRN